MFRKERVGGRCGGKTLSSEQPVSAQHCFRQNLSNTNQKHNLVVHKKKKKTLVSCKSNFLYIVDYCRENLNYLKVRDLLPMFPVVSVNPWMMNPSAKTQHTQSDSSSIKTDVVNMSISFQCFQSCPLI